VPTASVSGAATRSRTASPTGTPPICRGIANVLPLNGTSGTAPSMSTSTHGNVGMYTAGVCARGFSTFFSGPRLVYSLLLGDRVPVGGTLTVSTCGQTRSDNTVLYVGTGCPSWSAAFNCIVGNDNAAAPSSCAVNSLASTVSLTTTQANYFIQLGGINGNAIVSGLQWSYVGASPSITATRRAAPSPTRTRSRLPASPSRSASAASTRSRTKKPKPR
jgi:hypothetical protein